MFTGSANTREISAGDGLEGDLQDLGGEEREKEECLLDMFKGWGLGHCGVRSAARLPSQKYVGRLPLI